MKKLFKLRKQFIFSLVLAILIINSTDIYAQEFSKKNLSQEEKEYIAQKKVLKAAIVDNWLPFSSYDGENGSFRGLSVDVLRRLEEKTGLKIEFVTADSYREAVEMTGAGKTDIMSVAVGDIYYGTSHGLEFTEPYLNAQMMMLYNKRTDIHSMSAFEMAEVDGYPLFTKNPKITHMPFSTLEDCLMAIRSGHADIMYCDIFSGQEYIQQFENRDLKYFPLTTTQQFGFAISPEGSSVLKGLLNQAVGEMSRDEINKSLTRNRVGAAFNLGNFVYNYPFEIICIFMIAGVLLVVAYATYIRIKGTQSIAQQGYVKSYCLLADAFGEVGLEYNYIEDRMKAFGKYADKLSMPDAIEKFSSYLETEDKAVSLTREQFEQMLRDGIYENSYDIELKCRLNSGEWQHFRLIFTVTSTEESYRRPISMVGCLMNIEEEYQEKKKLVQLGTKDTLTGIFNRAGAEEEIKKHLESGKETKEDILLLIDVDYFKNFNDTYGHACGDDVLSNVGRCLKECFSEKDILCRWGGDEFFLYLKGAALQTKEIEEKCVALQKVLREYQYEGRKIPVTLSVGGAAVAGRTLEETFEMADKALYKVKENGRDAVCIISE